MLYRFARVTGRFVAADLPKDWPITAGPGRQLSVQRDGTFTLTSIPGTTSLSWAERGVLWRFDLRPGERREGVVIALPVE